mgnify:FL=1
MTYFYFVNFLVYMDKFRKIYKSNYMLIKSIDMLIKDIYNLDIKGI